MTTDTGIGDPALATAEKGEAFFKVVTGKIAEFLYELAIINQDELYSDK